MQNAAGYSVSPAPQDQNDAYRAVASDLLTLESSINIIVLADVSPRYLKAGAALQACHVNLGIVLRSPADAGDSDPCAASLPEVIGA
jgi:hypothetical protein